MGNCINVFKSPIKKTGKKYETQKIYIERADQPQFINKITVKNTITTQRVTHSAVDDIISYSNLNE